MTTEKEPFKQWAIVELFGHTRIAGKLTEQTIGGCAFVRIDVPTINVDDGTLPGFTKLFGQGAIYAISFVDEATARITASDLRVQPVEVWNLRFGLERIPTRERQLMLGGLPEDQEEEQF